MSEPLLNGGSSPISPAEEVSASRNDGKLHLLLAASGSVATIKIAQIIKGLSKHKNLSIRLVFTTAAAQFLAGQSHEQPGLDEIRRLPNVDSIYTDEAEWSPPWTRGAPILHIEMRKWADLLVVAPLSANTMAKIVAGMCDNLLTSIIRAWDTDGSVDGGKKKIVLATAMNTAMWRHPVTARLLKVLDEDWGGENGWFRTLFPISKALACGDVGEGAMVSWETIVSVVEEELGISNVQSDDKA